MIRVLLGYRILYGQNVSWYCFTHGVTNYIRFLRKVVVMSVWLCKFCTTRSFNSHCFGISSDRNRVVTSIGGIRKNICILINVHLMASDTPIRNSCSANQSFKWKRNKRHCHYAYHQVDKSHVSVLSQNTHNTAWRLFLNKIFVMLWNCRKNLKKKNNLRIIGLSLAISQISHQVPN